MSDDLSKIKLEAQALFDRLTWDDDLRALLRKLPEFHGFPKDTFPLKVLADYLRDFGLDWIPDLIQTDNTVQAWITGPTSSKLNCTIYLYRNGESSEDYIVFRLIYPDMSPTFIKVGYPGCSLVFIQERSP